MSLEDEFSGLNVSGSNSEHENSHILEKYGHKIKTDELSFGKGKTSRDKANRATVENVLDPRTMRFLGALTKRGIISDFNGCISSGKEANVYHAFAGVKAGGVSRELAIKIYKTSILVFKDRERYVDGEFRFRNSRSQHNPRKMIKIWAEKEFRNLKRIHTSGVVPAPQPVEVKSNVLVMEFLNQEDGAPSPRLKDYPYRDELEISRFYHLVLAYIRLLYQVCHLVHADLSEYNMVIHSGKIYIIDVSQSVEPQHPMSLDFLRMDIKNINGYFEKMGINLFQERMIFQFVISERLEGFNGNYHSAEELADYLVGKLSVKTPTQGVDEDEIFRSLHLVRNLRGLEERDFDRFTDGKFDLLKSLIANDCERNAPISQMQEVGEESSEDGSDEESDEGDEGDESDESGSVEGSGEESEESDRDTKPKGKRFEDKDEKRLRKKEVKEAKKEKRKTKVKKHVKKKLIKKTKSKK